MARRVHLFDQPDRFTAGTIGQPGNRTFYLQACEGARVVSVSLEKVQVAVLAERLGALLDELQLRGIVDTGATADSSTAEAAGEGAAGASTPPAGPAQAPTGGMAVVEGSLEEPLNEVFRAGTLSLGWDGGDDVIVIEAREITEDDEDEEAEESVVREFADDDPDGPDLLRVRIAPADARRFVERAIRVVAAGRPPCPMCGQPLDPQGHLCPRRNGTFLN